MREEAAQAKEVHYVCKVLAINNQVQVQVINSITYQWKLHVPLSTAQTVTHVDKSV